MWRSLAKVSVRCANSSAPAGACTTSNRGDVLIVMFGGGSKATQSRDIKRAKELARTLRTNEGDQS